MIRRNIPFDFVFDYLVPLKVEVKAMFGLYAIYVSQKIMLMLRQRKNHTNSNGVWIATTIEHHASLKKDFPSLCSISIYTKGTIETAWRLIPMDSDDFETSVIKVCEFIVHGDPRIGRIPKLRQRKRAKKRNSD